MSKLDKMLIRMVDRWKVTNYGVSDPIPVYDGSVALAEAKAQLRALVDEVIGGNVDGEPLISMILSVQRKRADKLFGVQQPYTSGHGGYDENFNADAELDKKTDMGEDNDN